MKFVTTGTFIAALSLLARTGTVVAQPHHSGGFPGALLVRQDSPIPQQCLSTCGTVSDLFTGSMTCTPSSCCTESFTTEYFNCFRCVGDALSITDFTTPQQIVDEFVVGCINSGFQVPIVTYPGQDPGRSLPIDSSAAPTDSPAAPADDPVQTADGDSDNNNDTDSATGVPPSADSTGAANSDTETSQPQTTPKPSAPHTVFSIQTNIGPKTVSTESDSDSKSGDNSAAVRVDVGAWIKSFGMIVVALIGGGAII